MEFRSTIFELFDIILKGNPLRLDVLCEGPKPSELYGKFTWKIENFKDLQKRELRSSVFEVGSYKW